MTPDLTEAHAAVDAHLAKHAATYPWYLGSYVGVPPGGRSAAPGVVVTAKDGAHDAEAVVARLAGGAPSYVVRMADVPTTQADGAG